MVIPRPEVYTVPYSKTSDIIKFTVSKYSKNFIAFIFKKDDKEFKNNSDPGYFTITELDTPSTVQVVLHIHLSGTYRLCYEFTNFTDPVYNGGRNCTKELTVKITEGRITIKKTKDDIMLKVHLFLSIRFQLVENNHPLCGLLGDHSDGGSHPLSGICEMLVQVLHVSFL